jgi:GTPase SAR1 family protein
MQVSRFDFTVIKPKSKILIIGPPKCGKTTLCYKLIDHLTQEISHDNMIVMDKNINFDKYIQKYENIHAKKHIDYDHVCNSLNYNSLIIFDDCLEPKCLDNDALIFAINSEHTVIATIMEPKGDSINIWNKFDYIFMFNMNDKYRQTICDIYQDKLPIELFDLTKSEYSALVYMPNDDTHRFSLCCDDIVSRPISIIMIRPNIIKQLEASITIDKNDNINVDHMNTYISSINELIQTYNNSAGYFKSSTKIDTSKLIVIKDKSLKDINKSFLETLSFDEIRILILTVHMKLTTIMPFSDYSQKLYYLNKIMLAYIK